MQEKEKKRILLMGLDDGLLWQLTKSLAFFEERIEVHCARDFSAAREICDANSFHIIVKDGWEQFQEEGHSLGWDEVSGLGPEKRVILVDSIPMEGLLDERVSSSAVFLEKPFNPREFPMFLLGLLGEAGEQDVLPPVPSQEPEKQQEEKLDKPPEPSLSAGESYRLSEAQGSDLEKHPDALQTEIEPPSVPESPASDKPDENDFFACVDKGFSCMKAKDWAGARTHWGKALDLRPQDKRVLSNLHRLEKLAGKPAEEG